MKNKIICLVLSLVLVGGLLSTHGAYAWFVTSSGGSSGGAGGVHNFSTGNVGIIVSGDFDSYTAIVPEDELLLAFDSSTEDGATATEKITAYPDCKMFLENTSSVTTQLRIRIEYGYGENEKAFYDNSAESPLTVELTDASLWTYNDGYLYYGTYDADKNLSSEIPAYDAESGESALLVPLFNSIRYSGENTESTEISGKNLTVKVIFESRQSEFVDWTAFGTINSEETV